MSTLRFLMPNISRTMLRSSFTRPTRLFPTPSTSRTSIQHHRRPPTRFTSSTAHAMPSSPPPPPPPKSGGGLTGKLKDLSKKYGRAAVFVYLGISLVDFGIAFASVHALGTDRIGALEDAMFKKVKDWTGYSKTSVNQVQQASEDAVEEVSEAAAAAGVVGQDGRATSRGNGNGNGKASLWTEVVIAYGIHKALFIFIRVPVTVAITPSIVKALVKRGWKIGPAAAAITKGASRT